MLDYVKIQVKDIDTEQLTHRLNFVLKVEEGTGSISECKYVNYKGAFIYIYESGNVFFKGSIHKFYNELKGITAPNCNSTTYRGFNGNLFTLCQLLEVSEHLQELFKCKPQQLVFKNVEVGINTEPNFNPYDFIKGLLYCKGVLFEFKYEGNYAQIDFQKYRIKIYNKSIQYDLPKNTLRFETRIKRTEILNALGLYTFDDLNPRTLENCKNYLLQRLNEVVYYDYTINRKGLTERQCIMLDNYTNPRYWTSDEMIKEKRRYHKNRLQEFINKRSNNLKAIIHAEIERLFKEIINPKNRQNITEFLSLYTPQFEREKLSLYTQEFNPPKNTNLSLYTPLSISVESENSTFSKVGFSDLEKRLKNDLIDEVKKGTKLTHKKRRICVVTGLSLERENRDAKYIRTSTLKWLRDNRPYKYSELCSLLLPSTGKTPVRESNIIDHLAKQVRNRYYNSFKAKREKKTVVNALQLDLF